MSKWFGIVKRTGSIEEIGERFDSMSHDERVREMRSMCPATQALLWQMAEGTEVTLADIVPEDVPPLTEVIHFGKNSLPVMSHFEKRFCRPPEGTEESVLYGYNEAKIRPIVGPGYFVVRETPGKIRGSVVVDYYKTPPAKPASWPKIATKDCGLSALVYGFMNDYLRRVSSHVTIGRAFKHHKMTNNYFLLCRDAR